MFAVEGPQLVLDGWAIWFTFIAGACGALLAVVAVWRTIARPALRFAAAIEQALPTLLALARDYSDDKGGQVLTAELTALATGQGAIAETQRQTVEKLERIHRTLEDLHNYSHSMKHDIIGDVGKLSLAMGTATTIVDALVKTTDEIRATREALERIGGES